MISEQQYRESKYKLLEHFWGHNTFRDMQEDIIDSIISGKDTITLLPTGAGKSLCFQLPALLLEGTCLVVSPLLALMKDQVQQLKAKGIEAEFLSSELDDYDAEVIYNRCKEGITKLLYVSPERIQNSLFIQNLQEIDISFVAIDEAHCISEWGQDFRPSYQNIKELRNQLPKIPFIGLTATATPKVLEEISTKLALQKPNVFQKSFKRENIRIIVEKISDKYQRIFEILKYNPYSGIIYVRTRKEAENLSYFLKSKGLTNVDFYHAGLTTKEKNSKQNNWNNSSQNVLISTNAFGMGIDKDDVRFVIHFNPSASIENYYQEIGRAGRDGNDSFAFMLWDEHEMNSFDDILKDQIPNKNEYKKIVDYLYSIFQIAEFELPEKIFQLHTENLKKFTKLSTSKIKNVLNFLHNQEIIFYNSNKSLSTLELKIRPDELEQIPNKDAYFIELLFRSIDGLSTHKSYFSETKLSKKIEIGIPVIKERIKELQNKNYLEYIDGELASIKFLKPRDDRSLQGNYWNLFLQIQKNKIQKWADMKFYTENMEFCKMRLILSYFGEKQIKNCGNCTVCEKNKRSFAINTIEDDILKILGQKPSTVEELSVQLNYYQKEKILEQLIYLLDAEKIKMLNFRTYTLS